MTTTVKGFEPGDIQYIFTCSNPYKKYERDILAQYNLSGGDYTYYKPQQSVASELAGVIGYENAEYSPGKIIAALPPQEGNDQ
jgi:hypothetical protein